MICPYASELGDDEGIPSGPMVAIRKREPKPAPASGERLFAGGDVSAGELHDLRRKLIVAMPEGDLFRKGNTIARKRKAVAA